MVLSKVYWSVFKTFDEVQDFSEKMDMIQIINIEQNNNKFYVYYQTKKVA